MDAFVSGEANYRSKFFSNGDNDPFDQIDSFTKVNLRVGVRTESWELTAYSRNVFDEAAYHRASMYRCCLVHTRT